MVVLQKNQKRVADNAYKHYTRSRPAAASESVKRVKELADVGIGYHPVFRESCHCILYLCVEYSWERIHDL